MLKWITSADIKTSSITRSMEQASRSSSLPLVAMDRGRTMAVARLARGLWPTSYGDTV